MSDDPIKYAKDTLNLCRYGVDWPDSNKVFLHKPMPDGYWVPYHAAKQIIDQLIIDLNYQKDEK